jgi:hypothetical protein
MSKIFEALQYAHTERRQLEKMARQLPDQPAPYTHVVGPELAPKFITAGGDRTSCQCDQYGYRIRRQGIRDSLLQFVGLYPWKCAQCHRQFHRSRRF